MFRWGRSREVQDEARYKAFQERQRIYQYEQEARDLERMEAELIGRLHTTQAMERQAFQELEQAMISASMPKRERILVMQEMNTSNQNIVTTGAS